MKEEIDALVENDTKLVDRPKNVKIIDNHWALRG
jgi:hypothetical protein